MPIKWKPKDRDIYKGWIKQIINQGVYLNHWEFEFVTGLFMHLNQPHHPFNNLTEAQAKTLEKIYAERTK